jgi:hypothetical protein
MMPPKRGRPGRKNPPGRKKTPPATPSLPTPSTSSDDQGPRRSRRPRYTRAESPPTDAPPLVPGVLQPTPAKKSRSAIRQPVPLATPSPDTANTLLPMVIQLTNQVANLTGALDKVSRDLDTLAKRPHQAAMSALPTIDPTVNGVVAPLNQVALIGAASPATSTVSTTAAHVNSVAFPTPVVATITSSSISTHASTVADAVQLAMNTGEQIPYVTSHDALRLGDTVDPKLKARIWAQEFIDLSDLIRASPDQECTFQFSKVGNATNLKLVPTKRDALSIWQWREAFEVYISIMGESPSHIQLMAPLMLHKRTVDNLNFRYNASCWRLYDESFRRGIATPGSQLRWGVIDWTRYMDSLHKEGIFRLNTKSVHSQQRSNRPGQSTGPKRNRFPKGYCFRFSSGQQCSARTCAFTHKCHICQAGHPPSQCKQTPSPDFSGAQKGKSSTYPSKGPQTGCIP